MRHRPIVALMLLTMLTTATAEEAGALEMGVWSVTSGIDVLGFHGGSAPRITTDAHPVDVVRIGDWVLADGERLIAHAVDGVVIVACTPDRQAVVVSIGIQELEVAAVTLRFEAEGREPIVTEARPVVAAAVDLTIATDDPLLALLAAAETLTITLTPSGAARAAVILRVPSAGFAEALPWLGCGSDDGCPVRRCGP